MTGARRRVDLEQDAEDLDEDARQALVERTADPGVTRSAWNQVRRQNRLMLADDVDED